METRRDQGGNGWNQKGIKRDQEGIKAGTDGIRKGSTGNVSKLFPAVSPVFPSVVLETKGMSGAEPCGCGLSPEDWNTIKAALCWNYRHLGRELGVTRAYAYLLCRRPHRRHRRRLLAAMANLFDRLRANPAARRILARAGFWIE